ncbi:glutathione ABC transporter substrate-binding protein [Paenibacillus sp. ACRRY]|uniref:glutathione ABC transporter substrate-binding protein n=1 Tax=Paenibacillus sp. ACRRY TaxID=2918208 RepID=UPI001EF5D523|nr:glutathione ABC transporter substrate-binding protein [Paenibacillus sp. ACRRY]MCG7381410.1 glutathione ABC transporter substrate-binding protein [Paenibacillus sp. ACRRY]
MKKRGLITSLLTLSMTLVISACSSGGSTASGGEPTTPGERQAGGTLVIARQSDANNLDPQYSSQINSMAVYHHKITEGLVLMDKNSKYQPALATEWTQVDDTTWEFKLREDVMFHDGTPFNAEAVQKTFARIPSTPKAGMFSMIKEVTVLDDYTVQFVLEYPYAAIMSLLASAEGNILSPVSLEKAGTDMVKEPVGTGPFVFESWTPGDKIVLAKNENYWGDKPNIDKVEFRTVPEDTTRLAMVETGEAQVAEQVPSTEIARIEASATMKLGRYEAFATDHIGFNTSKEPFDNKLVRQAIAYAVDKESIVSGVYNNIGKVTDSTLGPTVIGYSPNVKGYSYDLNKAKSLLTEAGYPEGFTATLYTSDNKTRVNVAEVLQSQLKGIGINLEVKVLEFGAYIDAAAKGETEMFLSGWGNATGDADYNQINLLHSSSKGVPGNHSFYSNPEVDQLIEDSRKETDPEKRTTIFEKAIQIELNDVPILPFRNGENLAALSKDVDGVWISPSGFVEINTASFLK